MAHDSASPDSSEKFPVDGSVVVVPLSTSRRSDAFAVIDAVDADLVLVHRWHVKKSTEGTKLYAVATIDGKTVKMHRFLLQPNDDELVDHRDGDGLNNRRNNLRACTPRQNNLNRPKYRGSSQYKGVSYKQSNRQWVACVKVQNRSIHLGLFSNEVDAALAHDAWLREHDPEFGRFNFPRPGELPAVDPKGECA